MQFKKLFFHLLAIMYLASACRKATNTIPCANVTPIAKDFQMYMIVTNPVGYETDTFMVPQQIDTFYGSQMYLDFLPAITFDAGLIDAKAFNWKIGDDPRIFTKNKFYLSFNTPHNSVDKINVSLFRERYTDVCLPNDNGKDTIQKSFYIANDQKIPPPQVGRFKGYVVGQEQDTFSIHIYYGPKAEFYLIDNFPKGASVDNPIVSGGYKGDPIGIIGKYFIFHSSFAFKQVANAGLEYALGKVENGILQIDYITTTERNKKQRFVGIKQP
jgi:hypothetical protein